MAQHEVKGFRGILKRLGRSLEKAIANGGKLLGQPRPSSSQTSIAYQTSLEDEINDMETYITRFDTTLNDITLKIHQVVDDDDEADEELGKYMDLSLAAMSCLKKLKRQLNQQENEETPGTSQTQQQNNSSLDQLTRLLTRNVDQQNHSHTNECPVKLPTLQLKDFSGNIIYWKDFWDLFEATIHNNPKLKPVEKLSYLLGQLKGEAKQVVTGIQVNNDGYSVAVDLLKNRYGNMNLVKSALQAKLLNISPALDNTARLRGMFDELESCLRSLETMGQDINTDHLIAVVMSKIPGTLLITLERNKNWETPWSVSLLRENLHKEICARESVERHQKWLQPKVKADDRNDGQQKNDHKITAGALVATDNGNGPNKYKKKCIYCAKGHWSDECRTHRTLSERRNLIKDRCQLCLSKEHRMKDCPKKWYKCFHCQMPGVHHRSLCPKTFARSKENANIASESSAEKDDDDQYTEEAILAANESVLLQTATTFIEHKNTKLQKRIFFDCGSTRSYITENLANELGLPISNAEEIQLNVFGASKSTRIQTKSTNIEILLKDGGKMKIRVNIIPQITGGIQRTPIKLDKIEFLLKGLPIADSIPNNESKKDIEILIGNDHYLEIVTGERMQLRKGLFLLGSRMGWILTGRTQSNDGNKNESSMLVVQHRTSTQDSEVTQLEFTGKNGNNQMDQLWGLESLGIKQESLQNQEDEKALEMFENTIQYNDGRYEVAWPVNDAIYELPDNYHLALGRLKSTVQNINQNYKDVLPKYDAIIQDQEEKGVIEKVSMDKDKPKPKRCHYIAHFPVISPQRATTKIRVVYDASAKVRKSAVSLNDCLYRGKIYLENLCGLLLRFRLLSIVLISDIEKAFLQVGLLDSERDITRFFWLKNINNPIVTNDNLQIYRFRRVPFGMISSPFLLGATIDYHLKKYNTTTAKEIQTNIYMDNVLMGASNLDEAINKYKEAKLMFKDAKMNLREWCSNSQNFIDILPEADKATTTKFLGLGWDTDKDTISIKPPKENSDEKVKSLNKRQILRDVSQLYDPLGLFALVTIKGRVFLQKIWELDLSWDDELPENYQDQWKTIKDDIDKIPTLKLPRLCQSAESGEKRYILQCFCDASLISYAATVYLVTVSTFGTSVSLVFAKNRVAPKKCLSIPRLELLAMLIAVRSVKFVETNLRLKINKRFIWSDSQCVLHWINRNKQKDRFVHNRIEEIKTHKDILFKYVNTSENPADYATRGVNIDEIPGIWWSGPPWLKDPEEKWPNWDFNLQHPPDSSMNEPFFHEASLLTNDTCNKNNNLAPFGINCENYSSLTKLLRITAWCDRFLNICLHKCKKEDTLSAQDLVKAEQQWINFVQDANLTDVKKALIKKTTNQLVNQLDLKLDDANIIRCGGRFQNSLVMSFDAKYPILLPTASHFTVLIIKHIHAKLFHAGAAQTLAELRLKFWIPKGRRKVTEIIKMCTLCKKYAGGPYALPKMPDLPAFRVNEAEPFKVVGIDYMGPLFVRKTGKQVKMWICLFTCTVVRAVHLELISDLSTEAFLYGFRRFVATRGKPKLIICDNATNFRLASEVIQKVSEEQNALLKLKDFAANNGINFKFIVNLAPWQGGFYERMIGIAKLSLRKALGKLCFNIDQLYTIVKEVESIINSRPLLYITEGKDELSYLSPANFLRLNSSTCIGDFGELKFEKEFFIKDTKKQQLIELWRKSTASLNTFWEIWRKEYLTSLRERMAYWHRKQRICSERIPKIGDVIQQSEKQVPRNCWKLGRIEEIETGSDGKIRAAHIKIANNNCLRRPINVLFPLECEESNTNLNEPLISNNMTDVVPDSFTSNLASHSRPIRSAAQRAEPAIKQCVNFDMDLPNYFEKD